MNLLQYAPGILASYIGSFVEFVEALTIVLAVGMTRGWGNALSGAAAGTGLLVVLVVFFGPSLHRIPLAILPLVVGVLLLLFGMRWLRKAVLRSVGIIPLHDEEAAFFVETETLRTDGTALPHRQFFDGIGFMTSFKATLLEGLEAVFIVIAVGASGGALLASSLGAALAFGTVVALGLCLRKPLSSIPENTLKYTVGILLSAFGTFWVGEGLGFVWPGADWSLPGLILAWFVTARLSPDRSRESLT
jgi:uncharacterized membrane protein